MRYLLLLTTDSAPPSSVLQRFTVELIHAGVLLAGELLAVDGLHVELGVDGSCRVDDAPASDSRANALWIVQAADRAEAVEWARRLPVDRGRVEVRRIVSGAAAEA
ncbi:hypothetical protein KNO15_20260 [Leifsonia shinshuensis]|uniref:YciI family protein n=1 Tax=Leifsonia shinshuensis TaxID=150026 RepID=UPI001F50DB44|nr:YciI family protein [Leifsonia shinshuensis]MCI0159043.1 hypothetical protein [Leifsonia shinshuensis]